MPYPDTWPFLSGGAGPGCAYSVLSPLHAAHIVIAGGLYHLILAPHPTRAYTAGHPERSATHSNLHSTTHRVAASFNGSFPHSQHPRVPIRQPAECGNNPYLLCDAQADRWGPAHTHDIYHTLSRDAGDEGFVAPPPAMLTPIAGLESQSAFEPPSTPESPAAESTSTESAGSGLDDLDLSVVDSPVAAPGGDASADAGDPGPGAAGLDLAPAAADEVEGGFDFGDFSGLIEEEISFDTQPPPDTESGGLELALPTDMESPTDLTGGGVELAPPTDAAGGGLELESPMDLAGGGMELESPMDFAGADESAGADGGLELEQPLSETAPAAPAAWQEDDLDDGAMDFGDTESTSAGDPKVADRGAGADEGSSERTPRSRPSRPRPPKKSRVPMIVGVVVLGAGAAGFFAWQTFSGPEVVEASALPAVVIPDIPAELLPRMRDMAEAAVVEMVEDLRGRSAALDIPTQPQDAWLGGRYLGNASEFEDIERFWLGIERFVDEVRNTDTQLFHDKYVQQVEAAGFAADTAAMLIERADSGFVAARDGRLEADGLMDDLINASFDLHTFLLGNEGNIAYQPASAGMSDPVLEAVPSTEALGDQMWSQMEGITDALARLGTLDRVTRERLFAVLFDRIRRAGIQ